MDAVIDPVAAEGVADSGTMAVGAAAEFRSTATTSSTATARIIRVRGTSQQLFEKYLQLGRDATSGGDRVMAESYFQHAEHYFRILNAMNQAAQQNQQNGQQQGGQRRPFGEEGGPSAAEGEDGEVPCARHRRPAGGQGHPHRRRAAGGLIRPDLVRPEEGGSSRAPG